MVVFPNAKINLGLNILSKRPDGFHDIATVFYPVQWSDGLEAVEAASLKLDTSGLAIDGLATENLCWKAWQLLRQDMDLPPVHMHLHKVIPMGAGLGGGSSDAAFVIRLFNEKFKLGLDVATMERYAGALGSDCPFFIRNKPAYATGTGDLLNEIDLDLSAYVIILVYPGIHIPTKEAYQGIVPRQRDISIREIIGQPVTEWKGVLVNDFEPVVFEKHPGLAGLKEALYVEGAIYVAMSGSGATVFGIFPSTTSSEALKQRFTAEEHMVFVQTPRSWN